MGIEALIYIYGSVCVSMIFFNCICIAVFRRNDSRLHKKSHKLADKILVQAQRFTRGEKIEQAHLRYLNRCLSRVGNLMAFNECLTKLYQKDETLAATYLYEIRSVFLHLSVVYLKKETVQAAYFAYLMSKYKICRHMPFDAMMDILKEYLKKDSLYCRQNAMKALYSFGEEEHVVEGIKILQQEHVFFHSKILADGLLTFEGSHTKLIALFWQSFDEFTVEVQVAILNYIRFQSGAYCDEMLAILTDSTANCELHYAAIRYFGKYHYPPAHSLLLQFAADLDETRWNYAAFSATALGNYPTEETLAVLKKCLSSSNWYVRYNAAQSIDALGVSYSDVIDIMNGDDRYAREMMSYRLDSRQLKQKREAPVL